MTPRPGYAQPYLPIPETGPWMRTRDGDPTGRALFRRHYSYSGGAAPLFVGPGEKLVLLTTCARALFVWRRYISDDGQDGVNCAVFRNEGAGLSSGLIRAADEIADERWPGERHFTYVDASRTTRGRSRRSSPGACFIAAGWRACGITKRNQLVILERTP